MYIPTNIFDPLVFIFLFLTVFIFLVKRFVYKSVRLKKLVIIFLVVFLVTAIMKFWLNKVYIVQGENRYTTNYVLWSFDYTYSNGSKERIKANLDVVINDSNKKLIFEMKARESWLNRGPQTIDPYTFMNTGKVDYFFARPPQTISFKGLWIYKCYLHY